MSLNPGGAAAEELLGRTQDEILGTGSDSVSMNLDDRTLLAGDGSRIEVGRQHMVDSGAAVPAESLEARDGCILRKGSDAATTFPAISVRDDEHMDTSDIVRSGDLRLEDAGSGKVVTDKEMQSTGKHLITENALDNNDTSIVDMGSVAVTHLIDKKNSGEGEIPVSSSCLATEIPAAVSCPLDENSVERESGVEDPSFVVNISRPETSLANEVAGYAPKGNESSVSISDKQDQGALSADSLANRSPGADAHEEESSLDSGLMDVETNVLKEGFPSPDDIDVDTLWLGEEELLESSDKQLRQHKALVPGTLYTKSCQRAHYNLSPQDVTRFSVGDLVWGKVKSYPWWPGQIFDHSHASKLALKHRKKDNFLVAYFGDDTFAWRDKHQLKPFYANFSKMEKQSSTDVFVYAVNESLGEVFRRMESGMACSCLPEVFADIKCQKVEQAGIREGSASSYSDRSLVMNYFDCSRLLDYVKALAQIATGGADRLDLVIAKAQLKAFYRLKGYPELPDIVFGGGLVENDVEGLALCDTKSKEFAVKDSNPLSSELIPGKRKRGRPLKKKQNVLINVEVVSGSLNKKPNEFGVECSNPMSSELIPGKRKRGRPSKKEQNFLIDVEVVSASLNKKPNEFDVQRSTPVSSKLIPGKRKRGRPLKRQTVNVEVSASLIQKPKEFDVERSTPVSSNLIHGKRNRGRPRKKQTNLSTDVDVSASQEEKPGEVDGNRKSGSPRKKQKSILSDFEVSASEDQNSEGIVLEHSTPLSSKLIPLERERGRPPKKQKETSEDARKEKSLSEIMKEKILSRLGKSGSGMKADRLLSSLLSCSGNKFKVAESDSAEDLKDESDPSDSTHSRKRKKRRLGILGYLKSKPETPNLSSSFEIEKCRDDSGESKRKMIELVVDLEKKSRSPTQSKSFKIGEYIRRGASRLTGLPPILKCSGDTSQKQVSEGDHRTGGIDSDTSPSPPFSKRRTRATIKGNYPSVDSKHSRRTGGKRGRKEVVEFQSTSSDVSTPDHTEDSDWSEEITVRSSRRRRESNGLSRGAAVTHKQRVKKMSTVQTDEVLSQLRLSASDPLNRYTFLSIVISFITEFRDSIASMPDHMKDSYWSDTVPVNTSEQGQVSNGLKQQKKKKKKLAGQQSTSCSVGPNTRPALAAERSVITVEEKIVDTPTALFLSFNSSDSLPTEADLIKIFGRYGPLRESETEVISKSNRAKVVFKRRPDAELAFSSAGKFSIFGPTLLSYHLKYLPSAPKISPDFLYEGQNNPTPIKVDDLEVSAQEETGMLSETAPDEAIVKND